MTEHEFGEACKEIIASDDFRPVGEVLPTDGKWTTGLIKQFLTPAGLDWQISTAGVGLGQVIKIHDEYLKYLLSIPAGSYSGQSGSQFYWLIGTDPNNDADSISPDDASLYLIQKTNPEFTREAYDIFSKWFAGICKKIVKNG